MSDEEAANKKRRNLVATAAQAIRQAAPGTARRDAEVAAEALVRLFVEIRSPEGGNLVHFITLDSGGLGGGKSRKPGNIWLNWRKLVTTASSATLGAASLASGQTWLVPFAAISLWKEIWAASSVDLSERHSMTLWALWLSRDDKNRVSGQTAVESVQEELSRYDRPPISKDEFTTILKDLEAHACIKVEAEGSIWLREWVKVTYD